MAIDDIAQICLVLNLLPLIFLVVSVFIAVMVRIVSSMRRSYTLPKKASEEAPRLFLRHNFFFFF